MADYGMQSSKGVLGASLAEAKAPETAELPNFDKATLMAEPGAGQQLPTWSV